MLDRPSLKEKGMFAFKRNYWPCVLVALILGFVSGGGSSSGGGNTFNRFKNNNSSGSSYNDDSFDLDNLDPNSLDFLDQNHGDSSNASKAGAFAILGALSGILLIIVLLVTAVGLAFSIFVANPLIVGCRRYFAINSFEKPNFNEVGFSFKKGNYLNIVKVEFMKNLFIFLWTLLLIVPGIIKSYEYYLVDYILSEDPTISYNDALEQSKRMMDGYKWATFVLELSFLGWQILSVFTCGILSLFYVNPYINATNAELFLFLRDKSFPGAAPYYVPSFATGYGAPQGAQQFNQSQGQPYNPNNVQPVSPASYAPAEPYNPTVNTAAPSQNSYSINNNNPSQPESPSSTDSSIMNPSIDPDSYYK